MTDIISGACAAPADLSTPEGLAAQVRRSVVEIFAAQQLDTAVIPDPVVIERPRNPEHGDWSTNIALQTAKRVGLNPRELATTVAAALAQVDGISEAEIAGPGFINLRIDSAAQGAVLASIAAAGADFGRSDALAGTTINLEFVSVNPTGPVHLGGARWAAVGDSLGRILEANGAAVIREFYFNDHGAQIVRYARSLEAAALGLPTPDDGYAGEYIQEFAAAIVAARPDIAGLPADERLEAFRADGVELAFAHIKRTLAEFGTVFDVYTHEDKMFETGLVDKCLSKLKADGQVYEADGAWWLRTTDFGDDKDRVVIKSDGTAAYIAGDIAYIEDKLQRGADLAIYMLGADHHGYIARLKAAASALGHDPDQVEVLIGQMVNLVVDGEPVRMSKRAGNIITLDDLVEAVGVDAGRYAMLRSSVDTSIDIDLNLLRQANNNNPVFYVQYAHARLSAIARTAAELGVVADLNLAGLLTAEKEGELLRTLGQFPAVVASAGTLREPHRVARYLEDVAGAFHRFYGTAELRVFPQGDEPIADIHRARLALAAATRQVLANGLALVGISAPERM